MSLSEFRGRLGHSLTSRAGLAAEFARQMAQQNARDEELRTVMLDAAPKSLRYWLNQSGAMSCLFNSGYFAGTFPCGDVGCRLRSVKDPRAARKAIDDLNRAWKGLATAAVRRFQDRIEFRLAAVLV